MVDALPVEDQILLRIGPAERLAMACRMFDTAKALAQAGVRREQVPIGESPSVRQRIFLHFYRNDFSPGEFDRILRTLADSVQPGSLTLPQGARPTPGPPAGYTHVRHQEDGVAMDDFRLLVDLHKDGRRQGPGGDAETEQAINLAMVDRSAPLKIVDIGCGTGASTLVLARCLNAQITAVDFLRDFLDVLEEKAANAGVADKVSILEHSMEDLPFANGELDIIWSEGAIYNIGFEKGVAGWRRFLKAGGLLVASEITWLTDSRPAEIQNHWDSEYAEIDVASAKMRVLEKHGFSPVAYFVLPEHCWKDEYYQPMQARFEDFLNRHGNSTEAREVVSAEQHEIDLYEKYKAHFSYGVYIARRTD
jgi:SAM-dependent methyltransferase